MKFKQYLAIIADPDGFIPTQRFQWIIRDNPRKTAREEAIASKILEEANPRENITGHFPWGPEQQLVLQQLWIRYGKTRSGPPLEVEWRDVPIENSENLYSVHQTQFGELPIPNAIKEPGVVIADFPDRLREVMEEDSDG